MCDCKDGWREIESAPPATTVFVAFFDEEVGEWCVGVAMYPVAGPWTHWRPLPEPPKGAPDNE
jgi:hypothetical protein